MKIEEEGENEVTPLAYQAGEQKQPPRQTLTHRKPGAPHDNCEEGAHPRVSSRLSAGRKHWPFLLWPTALILQHKRKNTGPPPVMVSQGMNIQKARREEDTLLKRLHKIY